jgi:hypothetical protein
MGKQIERVNKQVEKILSKGRCGAIFNQVDIRQYEVCCGICGLSEELNLRHVTQWNNESTKGFVKRVFSEKYGTTRKLGLGKNVNVCRSKGRYIFNPSFLEVEDSFSL